MIQLDITVIGNKDAAEYLRSGARRTPGYLMAGVKDGLDKMLLEIVMPDVTPQGYPGSPDKLVDSYETEVSGGKENVDGRLFSTAPDAKVMAIEFGRRPNQNPPPVSAIEPWVAFKLGGSTEVAYIVATMIGQKGNLPGHRMFEKTYNAKKNEVGKYFEDMLTVLYP